MGLYINPKDCSKEVWLLDNGTMITQTEAQKFAYSPDKKDDFLPVCLVDNGWMTAAAIACSAEERDIFVENVRDHRPKQWFVVAKEKLEPYLRQPDKA
jgi:hypothetical protein